jgi:hypothetical protein
MNFLKRWFGGSGGMSRGDKEGVYFYIRAKRTGEVIQVRLNRSNDLSLTDSGDSYYVRKLAVGQRSFDRIEAEFFFDRNRNFVSADVTGGELVERADYEQYLADQSSSTGV